MQNVKVRDCQELILEANGHEDCAGMHNVSDVYCKAVKGQIIDIMARVKGELGDEDGHLARYDVYYKQTARRETLEAWAKWVKVGTARVTATKEVSWYDDNFGQMQKTLDVRCKVLTYNKPENAVGCHVVYPVVMPMEVEEFAL